VWLCEGSECVFCAWYKTCGGVRGQSVCFVCGIRDVGSEGSECLFCVWYKMCGGLRGQSVCFVCGIRCVVV
jgi:hypothetical protein